MLKDEMLVAEKKEIGGWEIPHILQGEMMSNRSSGPSLDNVDDYWVRSPNGGYKYMNIELYDRGRRRRTIEVDDVGNRRLTVYARISFNSQR